MDRLKKFFKDSKTKKSFKKAGPGHRLAGSAPTGPSIRAGSAQYAASESEARNAERVAASDVAAQAAFKRMNLGVKQETTAQRNIRLRAMKELEEERRQREVESGATAEASSARREPSGIDARSFEHSDAIENVYFTCELLGDDVKLTKSEMRETVEAFLRSQLDCDAVVASSLMIFTLNGEKRQVASETLQKYMQNLIEHPDDPKYRRIRMSNKAFQDRVLSVKGGLEFLLACGFEERCEEAAAGSPPEQFLVISEEKADDVAPLVQALEVLQTGEPVPLKLHRNPTVYKLNRNQRITNPELSADFFQISGAEIKKEQAAKTLEAERLLTLRTQEMRVRDETLRRYTYNYTLIRIRFPNEYFLQGTFGCYEKLQTVREFVCEHLVETDVPIFILKDPVTGKIIDAESKSLGELSYAPAAVLNFEWDPDVLAAYAGRSVPYLSERDVAEAKVLN